MIQLVQPLEWREQPEHRPEALRLELAELEQVKGGGDECERQHGQAEHADRDVENGPGAARRRGWGSGASPMSSASPRSPVARGPVNRPTADARNRPSLATCSAMRNRASMESVGA